jgi:hypothetical protein
MAVGISMIIACTIAFIKPTLFEKAPVQKKYIVRRRILAALCILLGIYIVIDSIISKK